MLNAIVHSVVLSWRQSAIVQRVGQASHCKSVQKACLAYLKPSIFLGANMQSEGNSGRFPVVFIGVLALAAAVGLVQSLSVIHPGPSGGGLHGPG